MNGSAMLIKRFRSSIRRGTGEAYLIIQRHPAVDFSADIIKASLTNYAYQGQQEGSRDLYLSKLIALSKQQDKIRKAILKGLATERKDTWALVQLFDLATIYAMQGDKEARQAIYKRFFKKKIKYADWCGYASIIQLDGLEGLKFIAETIGKYLEKKPDDFQDDMIIYHFQNDNPKINVLAELEKARIENRYIQIYLDNVERTENRWEKNYKPTVINYDTVKEKIGDTRSTYISPGFTEALSKKELKKLAKELLIEKDNFKLGKYLSIFSQTKFPYSYEPILKLAKGKHNNRNRVVEQAVDSLKFFSGNDIRQFAVEKLPETNAPWIYLSLLVRNYKAGDAKLLKAIAAKCKSEEHIHSLVYGFIDIYKTNKTKECKKPLEEMYDKLTCGIHRKEIIKILHDNGVLSNKLKREIKHDSYDETRQLS